MFDNTREKILAIICAKFIVQMIPKCNKLHDVMLIEYSEGIAKTIESELV